MFKLAVSDTVKVPVKLALNNDGKEASFSFVLICTRLTVEEIKKRTSGGETLINEFLSGVIKGWEGQTLIVDQDDKPAEFTRAALDTMLSVPGASMVIYSKYMRECGAKEKN